MNKRLFLLIIWAAIFVIEIEILIANPSELSGLSIFICSLFAVIPLTGLVECLNKFKKNQKRRTT
jgi:hypothetical protein